MNTPRKCWCGNADLLPFGAGYGKCGRCGTLVSLAPVSADQFIVRDDDKDFYGKGYWLERRAKRGYPPIDVRARNDLTDRNLHWLELLLKYRLPPATVLDAGCAHGSFVALMRQAGYQASGIEMSPWVVDFGQRAFAAPIQVAAVETIDLPPSSLDVVVLMDVIEHLSDPATAISRCLELLKPDGFLLVQTPCFYQSYNFDTLVESNNSFLEMLIPDEHIYLFGRRSLTALLQSAGATQVSFEPHIFPYDMLLVAGREPHRLNARATIESALLASPGGRVALALLDIRERELASTRRLEGAEEDRAARLQVIERLDAQGREVERRLETSEAARAARLQVIERLDATVRELQGRLETSEADRAARLQVIERLDATVRELQERLDASEADRAARLEVIERLDATVREFRERLDASEADRAARLEVIEQLEATVPELQGRLETSEADRAARLEVIERLDATVRELRERLDASEADRAARLEVIEQLEARAAMLTQELETARANLVETRSELARLAGVRAAFVHAWQRGLAHLSKRN